MSMAPPPPHRTVHACDTSPPNQPFLPSREEIYVCTDAVTDHTPGDASITVSAIPPAEV
jgi:hypothetical protein